MDDTFTLLPLHVEPQTKAISSNMASSQLATELAALNTTHRTLLTLDSQNGVPPPPLPLNPKRSAAIQKMREQGNAALARRNAAAAGPPQEAVKESLKLYSYAIEMALGRPPWEPAQIVRDELSILMSNRSQSFIGLQAWPEAAVDAETSVECKPGPGQGKAWWRRGRSLLEMGRVEEAKEWVTRGLEVDGGQSPELKALLGDIETRAEKKKAHESKDRAKEKGAK